jgi:glycosyltransferase involved in cell wall biosynthesis
MKIGFFLPNATFDLPGSPEVGGIESFSYTIGEAMQRLGHEVVLFGGQPKAGRRHRETTLRLELFPYWETKSIPDIGTRFQRLVQRLHFGWISRKAWNDEKFDLALVAKPYDWPVAGWWKRRRPETRVIMGFHGAESFQFDRCFYKHVDHSFAVSATVAGLIEKRFGSRPALIPNPTDVDYYTPDESPSSTSTSAPASSGHSLRLAASGRLVGLKGFSNLVAAVAQLRARGYDVTCELAGDGPERPALEQQIANLSLEKYFTLSGLLDRKELRELLRRADVYVAPSVGLEAFSIAALEGASVGLPLILSDRIGLCEFLKDNDFLSYPATDVNALACSIESAIERRNDPAWVDRAARHQRMREQFSPEVVARQIIELLGA